MEVESRIKLYLDTCVWIDIFQRPSILRKAACASRREFEIFFSDVNHFELLGNTERISKANLRKNRDSLSAVQLTPVTDPVFHLNESRLDHAELVGDEGGKVFASLRAKGVTSKSKRDVRHLLACRKVNATLCTNDRGLMNMGLDARKISVSLMPFRQLMAMLTRASR